MEFHEKLQQLRKQQGMTQEQLAERLYVSRTAISKWESGRGYPNLDSLKSISRLFSVSIDELLSNDELIVLAETENRSNIRRVSGLFFGILDLIAVALLFMPLFCWQEGEYIRAVTLFAHADITDFMRTIYVFALISLSAFGAVQLVFELRGAERCLRMGKLLSMLFHAAVIFLFANSHHPYMTTFLFLFFLIKVILIIHENSIKA